MSEKTRTIATIPTIGFGSFMAGQEMVNLSGYPFSGTYRGSIWTTKGEERVVIEHKDGWLHIFNPGQIVAIEEEPKP